MAQVILQLFVFILSFLPGMFYMWIVYRQDKYDPEPYGWVAMIFFMGMLSTFPAMVVEVVVDSFIYPYSAGMDGTDPVSVLVGSFLIIGPVEEMFKFFAVLVVVANSHVFDEPVDALVYAGAAALGFASLENGFYCVGAGAEVYIPRAIMAVPAHLMFAGVWGWGLGFWRFRQPNVLGMLVFLVMFAVASVAHGAYDAMLFSKNVWLVLLVVVLLTVLFFMNVGFFWHARKISPYRWSVLPEPDKQKRRRDVKLRQMRGLSIGWIAGGTGIYLGVVLVNLVLVGAVFVLHVGTGAFTGIEKGHVGFAMVSLYVLALMAMVALDFFVAGVVIGRLSRGRTILEPAISAILALSLITVLIPSGLGTWVFFVLVMSAPAIFAVGCFGGWLGEVWQASTEGHR